jgi:hypothetical protein
MGPRWICLTATTFDALNHRIIVWVYSAPLTGAEILEVGNLNGLTEYRSLPTATTRCSVDLQVTG